MNYIIYVLNHPSSQLSKTMQSVDSQWFMTIIIVMTASQRRFEIIYPPLIKLHLESIEAKNYAFIRESLEAQLQHEPDVETRNRKPLKRPVVFGAKWEIHFGPNNRFRVFYRIDSGNQQVFILAIGEKIGSRLFIGGEEIEI